MIDDLSNKNIPVALSLFMFRAKLEQMTLNIGPEIFSEIGVALYLECLFKLDDKLVTL